MSEVRRSIHGVSPDRRHAIRVRTYSNLGVPSEWSEALEVSELSTPNFTAPPPDVRTAGSIVSGATITINSDLYFQYSVTALAVDSNIVAPTGAPTDGQKLTIRILDDGTARALTWDPVFSPIGVTLPATTTIGKIIYIECIYNAAANKWDVVAVAEQA